MSDTEGMVRIMEHASEMLRVRIETTAGKNLDHEVRASDVKNVAAMAQARAVLQLVAASVAPEGRTLADRLRKEYDDWAAANDGMVMTDGELASVARFLTGGAS